MLEVLRDAVWQFIGAILALLALLVSLWIYRGQKVRKFLVWDARTIVPLISVHKSVQEELEIKFRGQVVKEAYMASIMLANRGNSPITQQDYDGDIIIQIHLSGKGEIVSLDTTENEDINIAGSYDESGIEIKPFLLNPGEEVIVC